MPGLLSGFENLDIVEYRKSHCLATGAQIARKFGKSRQRIGQILKKNGVSTTAVDFGKSVTCPDCGGAKHSSSKRCKNCWHRYCWIPVACSECGRIVERPRGDILRNNKRQKDWFCSYSCRAKNYWRNKNGA